MSPLELLPLDILLLILDFYTQTHLVPILDRYLSITIGRSEKYWSRKSIVHPVDAQLPSFVYEHCQEWNLGRLNLPQPNALFKRFRHTNIQSLKIKISKQNELKRLLRINPLTDLTSVHLHLQLPIEQSLPTISQMLLLSSHKLTELTISSYFLITPQHSSTLVDVLCSFSQLQKLVCDIRLCMEEHQLVALCKALRNVRHLDLSNQTSPQVLQRLSSMSNSLKAVYIDTDVDGVSCCAKVKELSLYRNCRMHITQHEQLQQAYRFAPHLTQFQGVLETNDDWCSTLDLIIAQWPRLHILNCVFSCFDVEFGKEMGMRLSNGTSISHLILTQLKYITHIPRDADHESNEKLLVPLQLLLQHCHTIRMLDVKFNADSSTSAAYIHHSLSSMFPHVSIRIQD